MEVSSSSDESPQSAGEEVQLGKRQRKKSTKYEDTRKEQQFLAGMKNKRVQVKCNQSGEIYKVAVDAISLEDGQPLSEEALKPGSQVLLDVDKKAYNATVIKIISREGQGKKRTTTKPKSSTVGNVLKKAKSSFQEVSNDDSSDDECRTPVTSSKKKQEEGGSPQGASCASESSSQNEQSGSSQGASCASEMDILLEIRATLNTFVEKFYQQHVPPKDSVKKEEDSKYVENGINLLQVPAKDMCAYGRALLDILFTKEEQAASVILKTKKSLKPPLDGLRVRKLFDCVGIKHPNYDHKALMQTLGQKCRDAAREIKNKEAREH